MDSFYNGFISYGRADSKAFAIRLYERLQGQGLSLWFDQNDIPLAVDFQNQIDHGLIRSDNFLFIISPHSINSPYCAKEINLALRCCKRIIPLMHVEAIAHETWQQRYPQGTPEQWEAYVAKGLHSSHPNMNPAIGKLNWVWFREELDDFEQSFQGLLDLFEQHQSYTRQHTTWLVKALDWQRHHHSSRALLVAEERVEAENWLKTQFQNEQPPCVPTTLHCEFICESIKNANNLMTQVFLSYSEEDKALMQKLRRALTREGITIWTNKTDIQTGASFQEAIARGIEETDTVVVLISPDALQSRYFQREVEYALSLNKRIIPLLIAPTYLAQVPRQLREMQFIDLTHGTANSGSAADHDATNLAKLLRVLRQDAVYYMQHKLMLVKALKWERQNRNTSILLRGYDLRHAETWLKLAKDHATHPPLPLQEEFISTSLAQPPNASLDVFLSYSRIDSDFARRLNDALQVQGKTTWFDQESIASGADFQQEIYRGIESCDNIVFIISPSSVNSPYCAGEVEYASHLNKRIITVMHRPVAVNLLHPVLAPLQWIDFNRHEGDFQPNFAELVRTLDTDREHVRQHTRWSLRSLEWHDKKRSSDLLLRGVEFTLADEWLKTVEAEQKQPAATQLQKDFVVESGKAIAAEMRRKRWTQRVINLLLGLMTLAFAIAVFQYFNAETQRARAETVQESQIRALSQYSILLRNNDQELPALREGIRAARQLQQQMGRVSVAETTQTQVRAALQNALFGISEANTLAGHGQSLNSVSVSPDGQTIATAAARTIKLWNLNGQELLSFEAHEGTVGDVAFSPDGQSLATASDDRTVKLWSVQGQLLQTLQGHTDAIYAVSFSPDGQAIASASADQTVRLWSRAGQPLNTLGGYTEVVLDVTFSPDGQTLATAVKDGTVKLWTREGQEIRSFSAQSGEVLGLTFSPDGTRLVTAGEDNTAKIWTLEGQLLQTLQGHTDSVTKAQFSADGRFLATTSYDKTARMWTAEGQTFQTLRGHDDVVADLAFVPNQPLLVTAGNDQVAKLWQYQTRSLRALTAHSQTVRSVSFSPDGQQIATAADDSQVVLWNAAGESLIVLQGHTDAVNSVRFSPNSQLLASGSSDRTVKLWNRTGELVRSWQAHTRPVLAVKFSPDGQVLATGGLDDVAKLWTLEGQELLTLQGHVGAVSSVDFSPNGQTLLTSSDDSTAKLWSLDGKEIRSFPHEGNVTIALFSPDGKAIATSTTDNRITLWSLEGQKLAEMKHTQSVESLSFNSTGDVLAAVGYDNSVHLWSTGGALLDKLYGHRGALFTTSFSPDQKTLAAAGEDHIVRLWQIDSAQLQQASTLWKLDLPTLLTRSCEWASNYLTYSQAVEAGDRPLCSQQQR